MENRRFLNYLAAHELLRIIPRIEELKEIPADCQGISDVSEYYRLKTYMDTIFGREYVAANFMKNCKNASVWFSTELSEFVHERLDYIIPHDDISVILKEISSSDEDFSKKKYTTWTQYDSNRFQLYVVSSFYSKRLSESTPYDEISKILVDILHALYYRTPLCGFLSDYSIKDPKNKKKYWSDIIRKYITPEGLYG